MCVVVPVSSRWVIVTQDVRSSPPLLKSPHGVGTWKVDTMGKAFRFIRLRSTGVNGRSVTATATLQLLTAVSNLVYVWYVFVLCFCVWYG